VRIVTTVNGASRGIVAAARFHPGP